MKRLVSFTTMTAISLLLASQAFATDYNSGVVTKAPSPEYTNVEFGSGWYLRGDISYNVRGESESTLTSIDSTAGSFLTQGDYDDTVGVRVGFGYYLSPNIRLELNAEQILDSNFDGIRAQNFGGSRDVTVVGVQTGITPAVPPLIDALTGAILAPGSPATPILEDVDDVVVFDNTGDVIGTNGFFNGTSIAPINGTEEIEASYNARSFIASAYYDLPALGKFKPYLGAGVGYGRLSYNETRTLTCTPSNAESCGFPAGTQGEEVVIELTRNEEFWAPAYQLSAGAGIQIDDHWTADIGYSFTDYAGGEDLSYDDGTAIDEDGFQVHQVRVGLRYDLW